MVDVIAQGVFDDRGQPLRRRFFIAATGGAVVSGHILDAPLHEEVDFDVLFLDSQVALRIIVEGQQSAIELAHLLDERHFEMQAGLQIRTHHFTQIEHDGGLAFIDDEC